MIPLNEKAVETLNWSPDKQRALIGHLLLTEEFFIQTRGKVQHNWFVEVRSQDAYRYIVSFYSEYGRLPKVNELKELDALKLEGPVWSKAFHAHVDSAVFLSNNYPLDSLRSELSDWMKARYFHEAIEKAIPLYNNQQPEKAYDEIKAVNKKIEEATFEEDKEIKFDNTQLFLEGTKLEFENALTFGLDCFDKLLTPDAKSGSLLLGDTTVLLAPTNIGKTTSMITAAAANVKRGRYVLMITHEGRPEDIKKKILCNMCGVTSGQLLEIYASEQGRRNIEIQVNTLKRFFTYVPINNPGLTVEEVLTVIAQKTEDLKRKTGGKSFEMLIDDYPAKLMCNVGKNWARRQIDDYVYGQFVAAALHYNFHALLAIQSNRDGSKITKFNKEPRLLSMEDVAESWGPMCTATNVISLNRDPVSAARNRLAYYICKSRSSETGWAVVCRTDYAKAMTHGNKLGATYYRGSGSMSDKVDALIGKYSNQEIPILELAK